eukprot:CAMPEP_0178991878 /NCGR_PEP_ID=MMETSP0795-20121207/5785_1 /TAXON_ID=88552 /ORGANISM="Amoebophrya sp., Strain Ameob2" /LENGTH=498 /DNA_ID=CAMNT_0020683661 /DNA_START=139 /DNA_END=1632 /DNA_ORIENTATION=-
MGGPGGFPLKEKDQVAQDLAHRPGLGGTESVERQAKFLSSFTKTDDPEEQAWDETFIASVTEVGRERVRDHLAAQIKKMLTDSDSYRPSKEELLEVKAALQKMRERKKAVESVVVEHLKLLHSWHIDNELLQQTLVGKELNDRYWKGADAPAKIQKMSKSLVQRWLREHRSVPVHEIDDRRIEHCAADLEQNVFNFVHSLNQQASGAGQSGVLAKNHGNPRQTQKYAVDYVERYRTLTLRVRKWFTHPARLGKQRLREIFDGEKTENQLVKSLYQMPDHFFNARNEFQGPGKVAVPEVRVVKAVTNGEAYGPTRSSAGASRGGGGGQVMLALGGGGTNSSYSGAGGTVGAGGGGINSASRQLSLTNGSFSSRGASGAAASSSSTGRPKASASMTNVQVLQAMNASRGTTGVTPSLQARSANAKAAAASSTTFSSTAGISKDRAHELYEKMRKGPPTTATAAASSSTTSSYPRSNTGKRLQLNENAGFSLDDFLAAPPL